MKYVPTQNYLKDIMSPRARPITKFRQQHLTRRIASTASGQTAHPAVSIESKPQEHCCLIFLGLTAFSLNRMPTVDRNRKSTAIVGTAQNGTENGAKNGTENGEGNFGDDADRSGGNEERGNPPASP